LLKIASLFIFLLTAQFSFGQQCDSYPDYSSSATYVDGDQIHYQGKIWENRYGNNVVPSGGNVDYVDCGLGGAQWCFVFTCNSDPCQTSTLLTDDDFESGYGNWNDGGGDSNRVSDFACDNSIKVQLRDDTSTSNITSDTYNLSSYDKITIAFQYYVTSFENNEKWLLEFSSDNGSNWTTIEEYVVDDDFTENVCYDETITILASNQTFNSQNKLRFKCDASKDDDKLYIDDVTVSGINSLAPAASFTSSAFSVYPDQEINFTNNTSGNGNSYSWDFGDGSSSSTLTSPSHQYTTTGTYTVTLTATNSCGSSTATTTIEVTNGPITLFFEDFEDEADGATTGTAQGAVNWSSSVSNSGDVEYIGVYTWQGDKEFYIEMKEDNEYAYWTTDAIDISNYEDVNFSLDVGEYGGIDSDHYIETEYSTDNGSNWNTASNNGYLNDDLGDGVDNQVSQDGINANSLIIRIKVVNKDDEHFFDDILVQGQLKLPGCATNLSPANADTNVSVTPTLSWDAVSGATGYKVFYGTDSSTTTAVAETANTSVTLPTLPEGTLHYWKVVPTNARGDASGCSVISFTTETLIPDCATGLTPADGTTGVSLTTSLSWTAANGATSYKVYFDDSNATTLIYTGSNTSIAAPTLQNGTQYYWKVVATNDSGDATGCGNAISFTTIVAAPGCATGLTPTNETTDVSLTPTLSWSAATGATGYKVYYGLDSGTSIYFGETANTSVTLPQLGYETQYFWKVVPTNAGGDASGCSVISFTTLKNPAGSVFITGNTVTVSKNAYLYLEKDFTNTGGSVVLNSDSNEFASMIVEGTATGDITYNKYVNYVGSDE
ncbi:PKD domain-containing protein, partial [Flavobacteriaceae bacterium]|nr:PKD domain-containing protein [Flavobacteriaceae bacterium]